MHHISVSYNTVLGEYVQFLCCYSFTNFSKTWWLYCGSLLHHIFKNSNRVLKIIKGDLEEDEGMDTELEYNTRLTHKSLDTCTQQKLQMDVGNRFSCL